ncbi:hypothetical protein HDE_12912 [Halotydeus destructor]|nr:hypothetical protein HDE_12912 [Halotydeus destructor]
MNNFIACQCARLRQGFMLLSLAILHYPLNWILTSSYRELLTPAVYRQLSLVPDAHITGSSLAFFLSGYTRKLTWLLGGGISTSERSKVLEKFNEQDITRFGTYDDVDIMISSPESFKFLFKMIRLYAIGVVLKAKSATFYLPAQHCRIGKGTRLQLTMHVSFCPDNSDHDDNGYAASTNFAWFDNALVMNSFSPFTGNLTLSSQFLDALLAGEVLVNDNARKRKNTYRSVSWFSLRPQQVAQEDDSTPAPSAKPDQRTYSLPADLFRMRSSLNRENFIDESKFTYTYISNAVELEMLNFIDDYYRTACENGEKGFYWFKDEPPVHW